jgi:hypothetical protein
MLSLLLALSSPSIVQCLDHGPGPRHHGDLSFQVLLVRFNGHLMGVPDIVRLVMRLLEILGPVAELDHVSLSA